MDAADRFLMLDTTGSAGSSARVRIGYLAGAHGLKGALRLRLDDPASATLAALRRVFVGAADAEPREYRLTAVARLNRATLRIALEGIATPADADALRGAILSVAAEDLPALEAGQFYYFQAIGCEVATVGGERIGVVEEVFSNGAHDVLVARDGTREILIPAIADIVRAIDLERRRIVIEPVPGLLD